MKNIGYLASIPAPANGMTVGRHGVGGLARALTLLGVIGLTALAPACGPSGGTLTVEVSAPDGVVPDITVNGPGSYFVTIHETTTLENLPAGEYSIRVLDRRARVAHPIVDRIYAGTVVGTPAQLAEAASASVTVRFDHEPGSGRVWVPIAGEGRVISYTGDELTSDAPPSVELNMGTESEPKAVAIDARGNLWVSLRRAGEVVRIAAGELDTSGVALPSATIKVDGPQGIAFGEGGDLWIASPAKKQISRWGNILDKPARRTDIACDGSPRGVAFDGKGRMFVTTTEPPALLVFSAESLATPKPVASHVVTGPESHLVEPGTIALDGKTGTVWITNGESGDAVRFDTAAIDAIIGQADLAPSAILARQVDGSLDGLAFDNAGHAWFSSSERSGARSLAKGIEMQQTPAFSDRRGLFVGGPRSGGLGEPAFVPPSRFSPIRR